MENKIRELLDDFQKMTERIAGEYLPDHRDIKKRDKLKEEIIQFVLDQKRKGV